MAEALLSNEPRTLQEFGNLRESSTLQDISLIDGGGNGRGGENKEEIMEKVKDTDHDVADSEHKIKSSSLKRFFRMPSKKKGGEEVDSDNCQVELAAGDINNKLEKHNPTYSVGDGGPNDTQENICAPNTELRRFKFRFGRMQSNSMQSERSQRDPFTRSNFRASLSGYWNTVFNKQKKNKISTKSSNVNDQDKESDLNDKSKENEEEESEEITIANEKYPTVVQNILSEEIHALKISDENDNDNNN